MYENYVMDYLSCCYFMKSNHVKIKTDIFIYMNANNFAAYFDNLRKAISNEKTNCEKQWIKMMWSRRYARYYISVSLKGEQQTTFDVKTASSKVKSQKYWTPRKILNGKSQI